jgi:hypothetical protein
VISIGSSRVGEREKRNMTTATNNTVVAKRTTFDVSASDGTAEATSPKALADNQVKAYIVSLQQDIGSILEKL